MGQTVLDSIQMIVGTSTSTVLSVAAEATAAGLRFAAAFERAAEAEAAREVAAGVWREARAEAQAVGAREREGREAARVVAAAAEAVAEKKRKRREVKREAVGLRLVRRRFAAAFEEAAADALAAVERLQELEAEMRVVAVGVAGADFESRHTVTFDVEGSMEAQVLAKGEAFCAGLEDMAASAEEIRVMAVKVGGRSQARAARLPSELASASSSASSASSSEASSASSSSSSSASSSDDEEEEEEAASSSEEEEEAGVVAT